MWRMTGVRSALALSGGVAPNVSWALPIPADRMTAETSMSGMGMGPAPNPRCRTQLCGASRDSAEVAPPADFGWQRYSLRWAATPGDQILMARASGSQHRRSDRHPQQDGINPLDFERNSR